MGQCILAVADILVDQAERALPPEHKVIATRRNPQTFTHDFLVEGPWLPDVLDGTDPPRVELHFTVHHEVPDVRIIARWYSREFPAVNDHEWLVASYPSFQAFYEGWNGPEP